MDDIRTNKKVNDEYVIARRLGKQTSSHRQDVATVDGIFFDTA